MRTRVKFCGMTRLADAQAAVELGVDAIGFVFHRPSRRAVNLHTACRIAEQLPPYVARVAVFVSPDAAEVQAVVNRLRPNALQFHGQAPEATYLRYGLPYIKAVGMLDPQFQSVIERYPGASAILLDTHGPGQAGGTGRHFDWSQAPTLDQPLVLAGGLSPANVGQAVRQLRPYALDVASGIESAPGIKSHEKMRAFIDEVYRADHS